MSIVVFTLPYYPYCKVRESNHADFVGDRGCFAKVHFAYALRFRRNSVEDPDHRVAWRTRSGKVRIFAPKCADSMTEWSIRETVRIRIPPHPK